MDWPKSFRTVPGLFDFTTFELSIGAVKNYVSAAKTELGASKGLCQEHIQPLNTLVEAL